MDFASDRQRFEEWKEEYNKEYPSPEVEEIRFNAFKETLRLIDPHLAKKCPGGHWMGLNCFADMTFSQFLTDYLKFSDDEPYSDPEEKAWAEDEEEEKNMYKAAEPAKAAEPEPKPEPVPEPEPEDGAETEAEAEDEILIKRQKRDRK